jgi:hypothetical protein
MTRALDDILVVQSNEPRMCKEAALSLAVRLAPQYGQVLRELQENHFEFQPRIAAIRDKWGSYVQLYEDEQRLGIALCTGLFGENEFKELNEESKNWSAEQQQAALEGFANEELDRNWGQCNFSDRTRYARYISRTTDGRPLLRGRVACWSARSMSSLNRSPPKGQPRFAVYLISSIWRSSNGDTNNAR